MSQYQESNVDTQEFSEAGTVQGRVSLSTTTAIQAELSPSLDGTQESSNSDKDFMPTFA